MAGGRGLPVMGCKSVYGLALSKLEAPGHSAHPPPQAQQLLIHWCPLDSSSSHNNTQNTLQGVTNVIHAFVLAVPSIYFWRMKTVTPQGFIEGTPALSVHGNIQASDGGVSLDGQSGFLTTDMSMTDCLSDPALCSKGLSLGMTVKFDQSVKEYKEPRYLLDTGAQSSQTRGVSLYVKDGKVFFNLAISQKTWQVRNE